jgi:hypothetical protein
MKVNSGSVRVNSDSVGENVNRWSQESQESRESRESRECGFRLYEFKGVNSNCEGGTGGSRGRGSEAQGLRL